MTDFTKEELTDIYDALDNYYYTSNLSRRHLIPLMMKVAEMIEDDELEKTKNVNQ